MHHKTAHAEAPRTKGNVIHWARFYDLVGKLCTLGRDKAIRQKFVDLAAPQPGEEVLDVGCGTGTLAIAMKSRVGEGEVRGIDASPEMIEVAQGKASKERSNANFQVALIEELPFPAASFDLVTSTLMLHHLPDDLKTKGLAEIRRVLKPGGRFLALDFSAHTHSLIGHLFAVLGRPRGKPIVEVLTPMLKDAGFDEVEAIPTRHKNFAFIRAR